MKSSIALANRNILIQNDSKILVSFLEENTIVHTLFVLQSGYILIKNSQVLCILHFLGRKVSKLHAYF